MGEIIEINGPIVTVRLPGVRNGEQVRIGALGLQLDEAGIDAAVHLVAEPGVPRRDGRDAVTS